MLLVLGSARMAAQRDEEVIAFCLAKVRFLFCPFHDRPSFASIKQWEYACFLDHSVNEAAVD